MRLILALLPFLSHLSAEPDTDSDSARLCKGQDRPKPFADGNYYKRCTTDSNGSRVEIIGCRSVTGEMMVIGKEKKLGVIVEKCTEVRGTVIYDVATSKEGIVYNCRQNQEKQEPLGCLPVLFLESYNSFLPFGRESTIAGITQRCDLMVNNTAESIDFERQILLNKTLGEVCYFNGHELKRGDAFRIGKLKFIGCYDDKFHHDMSKSDPEWLMVANCEEPGVVPNAPSVFEYYDL